MKTLVYDNLCTCLLHTPINQEIQAAGKNSYKRCSIVTESVSPVVFQIFVPKHIGASTLTLMVTWRYWSRDHSIRHIPLPIGGPLELHILYLFSRCSAQHVLTNERTNADTLQSITHDQRTNQPTNKQTWRIAMHPIGGKKSPLF